MSSASQNFRLPAETKEWLADEAQRIDRTPGWLLRKLISDYRSKQDADYLRGKLLKNHREAANPKSNTNHR